MISTVCQEGQTTEMPEMENWIFEKLCKFIHTECGIVLNLQKKTMLKSRLYKRLQKLDLTSYEEYFTYLTEDVNRQIEVKHLINAVTTNKTEFFRENKHFTYLSTTGLPELTRTRRFRTQNRIHVWSAGCSTGEEPYTVAMVLSEYFGGELFKFSLLATDISTKVLDFARRGVYTNEVVKPVPAKIKSRYLMLGKNKYRGKIRIIPELRKVVTFSQLNFNSYDYGISTKMDIIFCRNVIIYFDQEMRVKLLDRLYRQMAPGGLLFIGHSETLTGITEKFQLISPTIYRKPANDV